MTEDVPRLYFSRRRMLNRLSFDPQQIDALLDPATNQSRESAFACLDHLRSMGLASVVEGGWTITDAGIAAMAANGVIYSERHEADDG